jgi:hypothetical protein
MQCTFKEATPEQLLASLCKSSAANNRFMSPQVSQSVSQSFSQAV